MGVLYSRIKNWVDEEVLNFDDLNAEFDNILNNGVPLLFDDYSVNVTQMQITADPGEVSSESLATTLAGELERLRFIIGEITGKAEWYETPSATLEELNQSITTSGNKILSGKSRSGSSQLVALDPDGTSDEVVLRGASTNFIYKVEGIQVTISTDVTLDNLQLASGDGTTDVAAVDDTAVADTEITKTLGENGTTITIDGVGSEITSLVGKRATFRINNGSTDEFFTAFVNSSTELTKCRRGYFFNTSDSPIPRIAIADDDVITLMKATWIFANTVGNIVASFLEPIYDVEQPTATSGQFWFDLTNDKWQVANGVIFEDADATLIGETVQDDTGCVGARTHEIAVALDTLNNSFIELENASTVRTTVAAATINVFGSKVEIKYDFIRWNMASDLDSGVSESASTTYHMYVDELGNAIISDVAPYDRREDLLGYYHPHQTWRSLGSIENDSSSDLLKSTVWGTDNHNIKQQTVTLGSDSTGNGVIADLTLTNLVINRWYRLGGQWQIAGTIAALDSITIAIDNGSTRLAAQRMSKQVNGEIQSRALDILFQAKDAGVTITASSVTFGNVISGDDSVNETHVKIEEIFPPHIDTDGFV